ncbi:Asp-tRNA(Asn)/Glu-tRNA(Gln) amidotransferase subunit GatB [Candidatus Curtissbacteria bacterium]|nr:Asp-tRNA(Asn)/Glu-tRNA(Gln) amidotransferase subunit GatB [Candidatus Curtissbacteria bacterium]
MKYEPVIGLEIHIELNTKSKMFCSCSAEYFGADPNTHTCPVCLGLPGALPVANKVAIASAQKLGIALHCENLLSSKFDRKNYFYPDLAKGYQISQYQEPFSLKGYIEFDVNGETVKIDVTRAHMEEDTGKLAHAEVENKKVSLIDFNRSGVPLVEIVSEPQIHSSDVAKGYAQKLQQIARYLGISDCDMEKGSMRIEPNVSLRPAGSNDLPQYKVELKNINSFRFVQKAIEYEITRQTEILEKGETPALETRGWDEIKNKTFSQRAKEMAHDYRYFPEPDLPPYLFTKEYVAELKANMPELPDEKRARFIRDYQLSTYDCALLTTDIDLAAFFEDTVKAYPKGEPKRIANWIIGELLRRLNESQTPLSSLNLVPASLAELLLLTDEGKITTASAKEIFEKMITSGKNAQELIKEFGVEAITTDKLEEVVEMVIKQNDKVVAEYKAGKEQVFGYLIGQIQRQTQGKADPKTAADLLVKKIKK